MKATFLIAMALLTAACADNTVVSEGARVGQITKLSHKALCNTAHWGWEGELSMVAGTTATGQGATEGGQVQVGAWAFSVAKGPEADQNVESLKAAMSSGHHVQLSYRQVQNHDACESGTDYLIVSVRDLEAGRPQ
jgi:hypothetical protein